MGPNNSLVVVPYSELREEGKDAATERVFLTEEKIACGAPACALSDLLRATVKSRPSSNPLERPTHTFKGS